MRRIFSAAVIVFSKKRNWLIASLAAIFMLFLFILLNTISPIISAVNIVGFSVISSVFIQSAIDTFVTTDVLTLLLIFMMSVLFGVVLTMTLYKFKLNSKVKKSLPSTVLGASAGSLGAGCACTSVLIPLFGAGAISILPLGGLEFIVVSLGLLTFSLYTISKTIVECEECKLNFDSE